MRPWRNEPGCRWREAFICSYYFCILKYSSRKADGNAKIWNNVMVSLVVLLFLASAVLLNHQSGELVPPTAYLNEKTLVDKTFGWQPELFLLLCIDSDSCNSDLNVWCARFSVNLNRGGADSRFSITSAMCFRSRLGVLIFVSSCWHDICSELNLAVITALN